MKQFGLSNQERIKSKKEFDSVYSSGEILFSSNQKLKAVFLIERETEQAVLKAAFAVSRKAGIAVWRNRVKRLFRESFRLNKTILKAEVENKKIRLNIVFVPNSINERRNKKISLEQIMPDVVDLMNKIKVKL
ncbi:MAG: ribonuclease P protein component [Ignavibacteria bacterium]|nr:ribonuclease P protein component [Ignavibacteria bacterium]